MVQPLRQYSQGDGLNLGHSFRLVGAVAEHACEVRDLSERSAILLAFELNLDDHKGTSAPGRLPNKLR